MAEVSAWRGEVELWGERSGEGIAVLLLHGLTATRRYVVMGSRTLEHSGHRVIAYDARGHGRSSPAARRGEYDYVNLAADLEAVLDRLEVDRAVLAGASMGAHTAVRFALDRPGRVAALALITPAYDPQQAGAPGALARWDALAHGLRAGGVDGFMTAFGQPEIDGRWRETVLQATRQRLAEHQHLEAVADALEVVPRSAPFASFTELESIAAPAVVVGSRDDVDPGHPLAMAQSFADALPRGRLVCEAPGESPLAWQGGRLSRLIADLASLAAREGRVA